MQIVTEYVYPPISIRTHDWAATRGDPDLGCRTGYGPTEDAAILDLLEWELMDAADEDETPYECGCGAKYAQASGVLACRRARHERLVVCVGDRAMIFDPHLFVDDRSTPLRVTVRAATVLNIRLSSLGSRVVDVMFDHDPCRISHGHFTGALRWLAATESPREG